MMRGGSEMVRNDYVRPYMWQKTVDDEICFWNLMLLFWGVDSRQPPARGTPSECGRKFMYGMLCELFQTVPPIAS